MKFSQLYHKKGDKHKGEFGWNKVLHLIKDH